jgi:geranylgeranyl diphosphate synthase type II
LTPTVTTPDFSALESTLGERRLRVEAALRRLAENSSRSPRIGAAIEDSLFAPAKRLRPILTLLVAEVLRGDAESVLPAACAVEMVHTASLILDDLPSMDDARVRRGRPTCHVAHGEAIAILAAFALMNRAFGVVGEGWAGGPDGVLRAQIAQDLARAVGLDGMIAGQESDLVMTGRALDFGTLEFIHSRKTGALFTAAAYLGSLATRAPAAERTAVVAYAKNLGLAFQIVDDVIDASGVESEAGKDVGQDRGKTTFVTFAGLEGARQLARELVATSEEALAPFGPRAQPLRDLARYVLHRRK